MTLETLKRRLIRKFHPLLDVAVEATNDCNLNCQYCLRKDRPVGYMDMSLFKEVIKQIPFICRVGLGYGGESILHPKFSDMVRLAQGKFRHLQVYSNGLIPYNLPIEVVVNKKPPEYIATRDWTFIKPPPLSEKKYDFCLSPYCYMGILWNGDVTVCCHDIQGSKIIGNVKNQSLKQVWHSMAYAKLRKTGFCEDCEIYPWTGI